MGFIDKLKAMFGRSPGSATAEETHPRAEDNPLEHRHTADGVDAKSATEADQTPRTPRT